MLKKKEGKKRKKILTSISPYYDAIYMYTMTFFHAIHYGEKLIFLASIMLGLNIHYRIYCV